MSEFKVTIPKPCREDWNQMTPIAQGRACDICKKNVYDLTRNSDTEIARLFKLDPKRICGRFNDSQLNRWIPEVETSRIGLWKPIAAASILTFLGFQEVKGNPINRNQITYQDSVKKNPEIKTDEVLNDTLKNDSILISGTVIDSVQNDPLPFANVFIEGTKIGGQTDFDGKFELQIPDSLIGKQVQLTVSYIGYSKFTMIIEIKENMKAIDIAMGELAFIGDVVIIKASLWQRIKWKFKRK